MTPETRYARTADGTHVAYQVSGNGPIDIVVLRAWYSNLDHEWRDPVLAGTYRRLGSAGRLIRLDRRGTGLSDRIDPTDLPTVEHRVDDLRAVLDAVGSERVVLIGLAHGAALCSIFAATYPERTAGLVVWSPAWMLVGRAEHEAVVSFGDQIATAWGTTELAREIVRAGGPSRSHDEAFIEWIRQDQLEGGSPAEARIQWDLIAGTSVDGVLRGIHVPTLVLWRTGSALASPYFVERIPTATGVELPGQDHFFISGEWRTGLAEMERFIDRVAGLDHDTDRILATIMFTDLVSSTERAAAAGDRAWREIVEQHHVAVRRELAKHRGREIDTAGDGFFAAFDAPARAIRCASAIRGALETIGLDVRIGLHAGECERVGTGLRGLAVHIGARVGGLASPGEILVTSTVRDLVAGSGIEFEDAGTHRLKGIDQPWHLHRVAAAGPWPGGALRRAQMT